MTESLAPAPPEDDALAFTPVPTRARHDGWTAVRQRQFIAALAAMGVVARAAKAVGMSATSAYKLRQHPDAASFAAAWDNALFQGRTRAFEMVMDRALNGITEPRYYRGRVVGTRHRFDNRLVMAALSGPPPLLPRRKEGE